MIPADKATPYQQCSMPWVFDRIEVSGSVFIGPAPGTYHRADFDRPREVIRFSLLGAWNCEFSSGPNLQVLANYCAKVTGERGFYGIASARSAGHHSYHPTL